MHTWKVGVHAKRMGIFGDIFLTYFIYDNYLQQQFLFAKMFGAKNVMIP
jgi:hypothetical protein